MNLNPPMTYEEYKECLEQYLKDYPHYRRGQAMFNLLHIVRSDLSEQVRGRDIDPFYRDQNIGEFSKWLHKNW